MESMCYSCEFARKTASKKNDDNGYVCCSYPSIDHHESDESYSFIKIAETVATGWVDLKTRPDEKGNSGVITNFQLITRGVKDCLKYEEIQV